MLNGGGLFQLRHDVGAVPDNAPKFLNVLRLLDKRKRDPICPEVQSVVEIDPISARELVVLRHLAQGMRLPAVAERLELSERTLETYVTRAQQKLGAKPSARRPACRAPKA
jgi:DNA-binding NarL/FixJ family response regulator